MQGPAVRCTLWLCAPAGRVMENKPTRTQIGRARMTYFQGESCYSRAEYT
jgi:hypothetical protein